MWYLNILYNIYVMRKKNKSNLLYGEVREDCNILEYEELCD